MAEIRYVHTNVIAKNWARLAQFYIDVFGCTPQYPERDLSGAWIEQVTQLSGAHLRGIHLALPGFGEGGPTLEIFEYRPENLSETLPEINRQGFAHIAFHVDDTEAVLSAVKAHGGSSFGEVVRHVYPELGCLSVVYTRDPEGNIIELQNWKR